MRIIQRGVVLWNSLVVVLLFFLWTLPPEAAPILFVFMLAVFPWTEQIMTRRGGRMTSDMMELVDNGLHVRLR